MIEHSVATQRAIPCRANRLLSVGAVARLWMCRGGYSAALLERGASSIVGVDVEEDRIATANTRLISDATFEVFDGSTLDFDDDSFDGAFMNEVFEHVVDEQKTLQ
jgi:ubiquinone/menaquinone biosynthesis C-methylase UbiE